MVSREQREREDEAPEPVGTSRPAPPVLHAGSRAAAVLGLQRSAGNAAVTRILARKPNYLKQHTFLGKSCGHGVNQVMKDRLILVERHMEGLYNQLPSDQRINPLTGDPAPTYIEWCGLRESTGGWRSGSSTSKHASGSAVDVNYTRTPYIVTRTGGTLGGERAGNSLVTERQHTVQVFDRATQFMESSADSANVSQRAAGETTANVYGRFRRTSDNLADYLQFAFHSGRPRIDRAPVPDPENATEADLLRLIPLSERLEQATAVAGLTTFMADPQFATDHPNWPYDATQQYFRILRDYEMVRIPMLYGNPSASPAATRNPANGFLDLRQELVEAMHDVGGLRWGAADLGGESGDMHHFDLGSHGGFTPDGTP